MDSMDHDAQQYHTHTHKQNRHQRERERERERARARARARQVVRFFLVGGLWIVAFRSSHSGALRGERACTASPYVPRFRICLQQRNCECGQGEGGALEMRWWQRRGRGSPRSQHTHRSSRGAVRRAHRWVASGTGTARGRWSLQVELENSPKRPRGISP